MLAFVIGSLLPGSSYAARALQATSLLEQAYPPGCASGAGVQRGFAGVGESTIHAVPGVFCIDPGGPAWPNFVSAAAQGVDYYVKNTMLRKTLPETGQCYDLFSQAPGYPEFTQHGTPNIRLWWPLTYEPPGTRWTLTIMYGTRARVMLPGEGKPAYIHKDEWEWVVDPDLESVKRFLALLTQIPWGLCEVPLLSNTAFYNELVSVLDQVADACSAGDRVAAADRLADFENLLLDACVVICPPRAPAQFVGVANTLEHPACCKLLADAEYVGRKLGIIVDGR